MADKSSDHCAKPIMNTAISIYVVGLKLQAYATRPKGGMGRLELNIVNFADNYSLRSHIPFRSCLVGLRL